MTEKILLWQMPPVWGLPNASPFCMKVQAWLNLTGLDYETRSLTRPPRSKTRKVPYIERPDGTFVYDSSRIIDELSREHGVDLDASLSPQKRAEGILLQRTFEEHLYFIGLAERWLDDDNWPIVRDAFFANIPAWIRPLVGWIIRRGVRQACFGQGMGRLGPHERLSRATKDLEAIACLLDERRFLLGDSPTTIDATAVAFLANWYEPSLRSELRQIATNYPSLRRYYDELRPIAFPEWNP
jgi:glutathione S-transferase